MTNLRLCSFIRAPLENIRALLECGLDPNFEEKNGEGKLVDVLDPARRALLVEFGAKAGNSKIQP